MTAASLTLKRLSKLPFRPCCSLLSAHATFQFNNLSRIQESNDSVILKHLYTDTIDTLRNLEKLQDVTIDMEASTNRSFYKQLDQLVVRHGMSTENVIMLISKSNNNHDFKTEEFLKEQIKISVFLQKLNDILQSTKVASSSSSVSNQQTIRSANLLQLCSDAAMEVENLAELTYNVSPEIIQLPLYAPQSLIKPKSKSVDSEKKKSVERIEDVFTIPSLLRFVVIEILKNAVHATIQKHIDQIGEKENRPGSLGLESEREHLSKVKINLTSTVKECVITVTDSGTGMTEAQIANCSQLHKLKNNDGGTALSTLNDPSNKLLNRNVSYQPVTSPFQGLGVGLVLSRLYVEFLGGSLTVQSSGPGLGTSVTCRVPLNPGKGVIPTSS